MTEKKEPTPLYHWEMSMQLLYMLSIRTAFRLIVFSAAGDRESQLTIQWLTRKR